MTFADIPARRLRAQRIAGTGPDSGGRPASVAAGGTDLGATVAALGAVQAQDYAGALWSVGLRCPGATEAEVATALAQRRIVRTWAMRGTLHLLAAEDVAWVLTLVAPRLIAASAGRWRQLGLDDAVLARGWRIIRHALRDGPGRRDELMRRLEARGIATDELRGYNLLWRLALERRICFGPPDDRHPTFVCGEDWLPAAPRRTHAEAGAELARQYFGSHGPATLADFVHWSGLTVADARAGLASVRDELHGATIGGADYWFAAEADAGPRSGIVGRIDLLPGFDEYVIGYRDRSAVVEPADLSKLVPARNGLFQPTLVIDGHVRGTWKRDLNARTVRLTLSPFRPLRRREKDACQAAAARYASFLGRAIVVDFV